jgi:hypothetical protein
MARKKTFRKKQKNKHNNKKTFKRRRLIKGGGGGLFGKALGALANSSTAQAAYKSVKDNALETVKANLNTGYQTIAERAGTDVANAVKSDVRAGLNSPQLAPGELIKKSQAVLTSGLEVISATINLLRRQSNKPEAVDLLRKLRESLSNSIEEITPITTGHLVKDDDDDDDSTIPVTTASSI